MVIAVRCIFLILKKRSATRKREQQNLRLKMTSRIKRELQSVQIGPDRGPADHNNSQTNRRAMRKLPQNRVSNQAMRIQTRKRKINAGAGGQDGAQTSKQNQQRINLDNSVIFDPYIFYPCSKLEITMLSAYGSLR